MTCLARKLAVKAKVKVKLKQREAKLLIRSRPRKVAGKQRHVIVMLCAVMTSAATCVLSVALQAYSKPWHLIASTVFSAMFGLLFRYF